ncbi:EAL domain-containing protein [Acetoanaerobium sticklandii]|uniref:EAL domain-containing protein n=1 Tax=Acetoanaerobium sticklandii TaxID=1511 RepID=UPI003A8D2547
MFVKILLVDDSASDRMIIKNMLHDYSIYTACDGIEAIEYIENCDDIDLMILDLNMPNMNGFQVLEILNSRYKEKNIKTIILTSYDEIDNEIRGLQMGAVDYIRKPIHMNSLKARIEVHAQLLKTQRILEQQLQEQGLTLDLIINQAPIGIAISYSSDLNNIWRDEYCIFSPMFLKITGRSRHELISLGWESISHPDDLDEELVYNNKLRTGELESYTIDKRIIKPDGSVVWVHLIMSNIYLSPERPCNQICLIQDITPRKSFENALIESERSKSVLLSHLPGLAYRCNYDDDWTMQFVSDGCYELTGYKADSLLHNKELSYNDMISPEYRETLSNEWKKVLKNRDSFSYEYEIITSKKEKKWVIELGEGIFDKDGNIEALEGIVIDISYRKAMENELKYSNEHDRWTGLYNRNYLEELILRDIESQSKANLALVGINLSAVSSLNKMYGFQYIQELIKVIVENLNVHVTKERLLFSTYENRFVFYVNNYEDIEELKEFGECLAKTLEPYISAERVGVGIGILEIGYEECNVDNIFKKLLIASEKAIEINDRDYWVCVYDNKLETEVMREQEIKHELTKISQLHIDGSLYIQYQPIFDLRANKVTGFEALSRINSEKLGFISPLEFIPITEETKLIIPIGEKIISKSLDFLFRLNSLGFEDIDISINLSVIQLFKKDFPEKLFKIIREKNVNPKNIILEITESIFSSDYDYLNIILNDLKRIGLKISIDDFGTGYSSLSRERDLNIDCLKLDKSFIDKLMYLSPEEAITGDIISMAHKLGHSVVAEGVEHEKQMNYLKNFDCDRIQGYLISRPLDEAKAIEFLK